MFDIRFVIVKCGMKNFFFVCGILNLYKNNILLFLIILKIRSRLIIIVLNDKYCVK